MKKNTKALMVIGLALFMVPQIAFASWWNPFSWFQNPKQIEQKNTQVLEQRIQELESRLNDISSVPPIPPTTALEGKNEATGKAVLPRSKTTNVLPQTKAQMTIVPKAKQAPAPVADTTLDTSEVSKRLQDISKQISYRISEMQSYIGEAGKLVSNNENIRNQYNKISENFSNDSIAFKGLKHEIDMAIKNNQLADYSSLISRYNAANAAFEAHKQLLKGTQSQIDNKVEAPLPVINAACSNAQDVLDGLNKQYSQINAEYSAKKEGGGTQSRSAQQADIEQSYLADTYGRKLADIATRQMAAQNNVLLNCGNGVQTPIIQNNPYTPIRTYCNAYDNSISCNTYSW